MKSTIDRTCLLSDPANPRRHSVTGPGGVKLATEAASGAGHQALDSGHITGATKSKVSIRELRRIATWNVRGLLSPGKLDIVEKEAESHNIALLGVTETHKRGQGHYRTSNGNTLYFSGPANSSTNGVAILLSRQLNNHVMAYNPVSDRIISLKLNTYPCTLNMVVVYSPTSTSEEATCDEFYSKLEGVLSEIPNREITMVIGDWNAKIGSTIDDDHLRNTVGKYGLGTRNDRGTRLLEFCIDKKLTIMNTCFQHHARRLYTWTSPGDRCRNQIDYILISSRWRSSITNVKTFPGADCGSDHCLLVAKFALRLKAIKKKCLKPMYKLTPAEQKQFQSALDAAIVQTSTSANVDPDEQWRHLKDQINETFEKVSNKHPRTPCSKQTWIADKTWKLIQDRKELRSRGLSDPADRVKYSELSRMIQRQCRRDKNNFVERICKEVEEHAFRAQSSDLFKKVKLLTKQFKPRSWLVEDEDGTPLQDLEAVTKRWRNYCENLYKNSHDCSSPQGTTNWCELTLEPPILESEITAAIDALKYRKAPGPDRVTSEIIKAMGPKAVKVLHRICDNIWRTGRWPSDWTKSIILPIHKKGSTSKCDNYRTLALISHASKVMLHIINNRIRYFLNWQIPQEQAGFVKGKGTREQILNIRQLVEKAYEFNTPTIFCFIDYSKAFDCVVWSDLWKVLSELGVPQHLVALIRSLYLDNQGMVKVENCTSELFSFGKGVRQGCILSPILFNAYGEYIIRRACEGWEGGVTIGGTKITNLRYADDTTLLAANETEMVNLLARIEKISLLLGLKINHSKTKVMIVDRNNSLELTGTLNLDTVNDFVYLGSNINNTGSCEKEIRRRIGMAKNAMSQLHRIWRDRNITRKTKTKLVTSLVFSIFSYGAETWTLKKADRDRIDAFEMWSWRKMLQIPWTAFRTNVSILRELNVKTRLSTICLRRVLEFFGHIARKEGHNLEQLMVTGKVDGKRPRGRSPTRWSDQIRSSLNINFHNALHEAKDRSRWREIVREKLMQRGSHDPQ